MNSISPKAYSYIRFSSLEQQKGDSLRRQVKLANDYAAAHKLELDTELNLRDLGVSAFRGANLATGALGAFLDAVQKGIVPRGSFLLVESLDRVSRNVARKAVRILEDIVEAGVTVVTLNDGKAYTEESLEGTDFLIAIIILIRAHEESATKARRLKAAWHGKRLKIGEKVLTALTPGWIELDADRKPVLIEERAKIVRRIVRDYIKGAGKDSIARALNAEQVPCWGRGARQAKYWHRSYIQKMLDSPALVGTFVPHIDDHTEGKFRRIPQEPVLNYFPAVIDSDTHAHLQALMNRSPLRGRHAGATMRNVLSGLAKCPLCAGPMNRASKGGKAKQGYPFLICARAKQGAGCEYRSVRYDIVEAELFKNYQHLIASMPHPDADVEGALQSAQAAVDELEQQIAGLLDLLERTPSDAVASRVVVLELSLKVAREALSEVTAKAAMFASRAVQLRSEELGVAIRARPVDLRRINAALRAMLDRVTINYTSGHLEFDWKAGGMSSLFFMWPASTQVLPPSAR